MNRLAYEARKNMDQRIPLYSMKGPPTTSDSAVGISNGWRSSSARMAARKMKNASGCHTTSGTRPWNSTISLRFRLPATIETATSASTSGIS